MGHLWQFTFAAAEVLTLAVIALFLVVNFDHETVWRVTLVSAPSRPWSFC